MDDVQVIREPAEMREQSRRWRSEGHRIGFVPTMGYLHEGHLSLVRLAAARCDRVVVSIFVNPTQFGEGEDLDAYPRDEAGDLAKCREAGAHMAWIPDTPAMYTPGYQTRVEVAELSKPLCGASRPVHFSGVATVVTKLFNVVEPDVAVFGQKDYQQLQVVRRLVQDLDFAVEVLSGPTVREPDGVAMSSRNAYMTSFERSQATCLVQGLRAAWARFDAGERDVDALVAAARATIDRAPDTRVDYVEVRHPETLEPLTTIEDRGVLAMAVFLGKARLIDNTVLGGAQRP